MKQKVLFLALVLFAKNLLADSVTLSERWVDSLVSHTNADEVSYQVRTTITTYINATVTISGLRGVPWNEDWEFHLETHGSFAFGGGERKPNILDANHAVFIVSKVDDQGNEYEEGRLTITRNGDKVTLMGHLKFLGEFATLTGGWIGTRGPFGGENAIGLTLGEFTYGRPIYYRGSGSLTRRTVGSGESLNTFQLFNIQASGAADFTLPSVTIVSPQPDSRVEQGLRFVSIRAADNRGVARVVLRVNGSQREIAYDRRSQEWTAEIGLHPGANVIEAQSFDGSGNASLVAVCPVYYVFFDLIRINATPGGTFHGLKNWQRLEVGVSYSVTARANPGYLFTGWAGTVNSSQARVVFTMTPNCKLWAYFVPDPFLPIRGSYQGLFSPETNGPATTNSGSFQVTLREKGAFSGKLLLAGASVPFSGRCGLSGRAVVAIPRLHSSMNLQFEFSSATNSVHGTISNAFWIAALSGDRAGTSLATSNLVGSHTFVIPGLPTSDAATRPVGDGIGTLLIGGKGTVRVAGTLGDGTPFTQSTGVSTNGWLPLHVGLPKGRGLLIGWANASSNAAPYSFVGSNISWIKLAQPTDKIYPAGFDESRIVLGARYTSPSPGIGPVNWVDGVVLLDGGNVSSTVSNRLQWITGKPVALDDNPQKIAVTAKASGLFDGSFVHPVTGLRTSFKGAVMQLPAPAAGWGGGWFPGTNETGYIRLMPINEL